MSFALCTCGEDIVYHKDRSPVQRANNAWIEHEFIPAGTAHRCLKKIELDGGYFLCPRPAFHYKSGIECGVLTEEYLWVDNP